MIVHSVFCFSLLMVCVMHSLYVCVEGHLALLDFPRFFTPRELSALPPPFGVGGHNFSIVYHLLSTSLPRSQLFRSFFSMKRWPTVVSLLPQKNFFCSFLPFSSPHFFSVGQLHQYQNRFAQCTAQTAPLLVPTHVAGHTC